MSIVDELYQTGALVDVHIQQTDRNTDALKAILRQICINAAEDQAQRNACFTRVE